MKIFFLLSVQLLLSTSVHADLIFEAPGIGRISVSVRRINNEVQKVEFRDSQERLLKRVLYSDGFNYIDLYSFNFRGFPSPLIFLLASASRADGITIETKIMGVMNHTIIDVFNDGIVFDFEDAICVNEATASEHPNITVITQHDGPYCVLCWPKYYEVQVFVWENNKIKKTVKGVTKNLHDSARSASDELNARCKFELISETLQRLPKHQ